MRNLASAGVLTADEHATDISDLRVSGIMEAVTVIPNGDEDDLPVWTLPVPCTELSEPSDDEPCSERRSGRRLLGIAYDGVDFPRLPAEWL